VESLTELLYVLSVVGAALTKGATFVVARTLLSRLKSLGNHAIRASDITGKKLAQARELIAEKNEKLARARARLAESNEELKDARRRMAEKDRELAKLRSELERSTPGTRVEGLRPENIVWIFGTARTGSTWLSALMGDPPMHEEWREPNVGNVFGTHYYRRLETRESGGLSNHWKRFYVLGHDEARRNSIRAFLLEGARTRFPDMTAAGYLVIKEPHGSMGAPLLMEALPESRMVFLIRDPRDVASSALNARKKGSWLYNRRHAGKGGGDTLGDVPPDEIVCQRAETYLDDVQKTKMAYEAHEGHKVLVRYEDLRADTVGTLRRIYDALDIPMGEEELVHTVERHSFENIPEENKGPDKFRRKATPGGWRNDLTPEQAETVERITAPLLREYYGAEAGRPSPAG
jgi:hypothetical protein